MSGFQFPTCVWVSIDYYRYDESVSIVQRFILVAGITNFLTGDSTQPHHRKINLGPISFAKMRVLRIPENSPSPMATKFEMSNSRVFKGIINTHTQLEKGE